MAAAYLDQFLESIQTLPADVSRNLILVRELDEKCHDIINTANKQTIDYIKEASKLKPEEKTKTIAEVFKHWDKATRYSEDKYELMIQAYNLVDKHIRRLDTELAKLDTSISEESEETTKQSTSINLNKKKKVKIEQAVVVKQDLINKSGRKRKSTSHGKNARVVKYNTKRVEVLDMEVDPNEPHYCTCRQVSYGEMVGCDDSECEIEWFHFDCMGLGTKPKGKWYCPECKKKRGQQ